LDADTASSLIIHKVPITYPDAARKAGIQGTVALKIVTSVTGDVAEVTVISGDPALTLPVTDTVKQWKYNPYLVDGTPAEMEIQLTVNFQVKAPAKPPQPVDPPLGKFWNDTYSNDYFDIYYPLSRDWVRETNLMRSRVSAEQSSLPTYVLLSAVHIPQDTDPLRADSSFTVLAVNVSSGSSSTPCKEYLQSLAASMQAQKEGEQKGAVSQFTVAGHDFYRADFEYRRGVDHRAILCTFTKNFLLQWNIVGWSKPAIETAVSTLNAMLPSAPATAAPEISSAPLPVPGAVPLPTKVRVSTGVSTGLLLKKITPVYPEEARHDRIQGSVVLKVIINKAGDIADMEVVSGPVELVVSAVNAVRKWKYRPYLLQGDPVAVETQVVVNYALQ
jgi:TonB family protein